jgi:hypothetical protein
VIAAALVLALAAPRPEGKVNQLIAAIDKALQGDKEALQGFGVEQVTFVTSTWEDKTSVDGDGTATYFTHGSERIGDDVGLYRAQLTPEELRPILLGAKAVVAAPLAATRAEPYETRVILSIVAGGQVFRFATAIQPPALDQLNPLLHPLQRAVMKAAQNPVRALTLVLEAPEGIVRGAPTPLLLHMHNPGTEGMWVDNPAVLPNKAEGQRVQLSYAAPLQRTPGVTPVPTAPKKVLLAPAKHPPDAPAYLWLGPKGKVTVALQGVIEPPEGAKDLVLAVELIVNQGEEEVASRPRFRGALLSTEVQTHLR